MNADTSSSDYQNGNGEEVPVIQSITSVKKRVKKPDFKKKNWKNRNAIIFAIVFVALGAYIIFRSFASTVSMTNVWNTNAEWNTGTLNSVAVANNDVTLSSTTTTKTVVPTTDLALNKPCVASSVSNDGTTGASLPCADAFDGNTATRWSSAYSDPQWVYVDLGTTYNISEVKLTWETAYAKDYEIQVSNDAINWTTIYTTTTGTGGVNDLTGLTGSGRYVRMYGTARGTQWGYSLWEMAAFGTPVLQTTQTTTYASSGNITLNYDAGSSVTWTTLTPQVSLPTGTNITFQARTSSDDSTWSAWSSNVSQLAASRYIQIEASLSTTNTSVSPSLNTLTLGYNVYIAPPTVTLNSSSTSLTSGQSATLTWSSNNATSCTASGTWSGNQPTSGSVSTGALTTAASYTLTCNGAGGSANATTNITVTAPAAGGGSGSSAPTTMAPPPGFTAAQQTMDDQFGNSSSYNLLKNWNFGITDNTTASCSSYYTWEQSGTAPYYGAAEGQTYDAEYYFPQAISQTSTGDAYNGFSSSGSGLTITAKYAPGTVNSNYSYTWSSGSLNTYNKEQIGGNGTNVYVQVKAQMPYAVVNGSRVDNGAWAGIWLLPGCGNSESDSYETDMIESGYTEGSVNPLDEVATNLHTGSQQFYNAGTDLSAGYHIYGLDLNTATGAETFYLDGKEYASYSSGGPTGPMFLLLTQNIATSNTVGWHAQVVSNSATSAMNVAEVQMYSQN